MKCKKEPRFILIRIEDPDTFNWKYCFDLWQCSMPQKSFGHNGDCPGDNKSYVWSDVPYKIGHKLIPTPRCVTRVSEDFCVFSTDPCKTEAHIFQPDKIRAIEVANRSLAERVSVVETDMIGHAGSHMKYNLQERVNNLERKIKTNDFWMGVINSKVDSLYEKL